MTQPITIRRARPEEAPDLSDLALRAKAHWGYDDAFLAACREDLAVQREDIVAGCVWVGERAGAPVGFIAVRIEGGVAELGSCFVDPAVIGSGVGRVLWETVEGVARAAGVDAIGLDADPYAEGFYLAMGAERVGAAPSGSIPGRMLPRMVKRLV